MKQGLTNKVWKVAGKDGFDALKLDTQASIPEPTGNQVLVKIHAASLNYRDLVIPKGMYPFPQKDNVVPGSDGAGEVVSVGPLVTRFKPGDKVVTLFNQGHIGGSLTPESLGTGLGGVVDGTLREYGAFSEEGLVHMPKTLSYNEAATLSCAALTAWNALYGGQKPLTAGDTVVTQGTGGVSVFAIQFALAAGATVIATTSSAEKAAQLKKLGAQHVINYKEDPNWGQTAKKLSYNGEGAAHVIEVGGPTTMKQSLEAVKIDGQISVIGFIGGFKGEGPPPTFLDCLNHICTVRGILVGNRAQLEDMVRAIDANNIKPVVDKKTFKLDELKEAYQYMWDQKHFGKLVVTCA